MNPIVYPTIPRVYTALAQWLACFIFIRLCHRQRRLKGITLVSGLCLGLALLMVEMIVTRALPVAFWIPSMLGAAGLMCGMLWLCCDFDLYTLGHCFAWAFLLSEFSASLSWQLSYFVMRLNPDLSSDWCVLAITIIIYGLVFTLDYILLKHRIPNGRYQSATKRQFITTLTICLVAFLVSNLSFVVSNTPFTSEIDTDVYNIRTLVDLGGLVFLYAFNVQEMEMKTRYERDVIQNALETQYLQFQQTQESIDLVNRKYHDLKHQIAALRAESDADQRNRWLDQLEEDISVYEAQNQTGNSVLDIILTRKQLQCQKRGIALTCVADGSLLDFMAPPDICTIFGNALENAIESVSQLSDLEKRLIHLSVSAQRSFVLIRVENYFEGELQFEDGLPKSTKGDDRFHGFGVKSIRYAAQKYDGSVSITARRNWFDLKILIPQEDSRN